MYHSDYVTGTGDTSDTSADALNLMEKLMNSDINGMKLYIDFIHVRLLSVIIEKKMFIILSKWYAL